MLRSLLNTIRTVPLATALPRLGIAVTPQGFFRRRDERTPSCHILPSGVMWYDHGTHESGDLLQLYREQTGQGFTQAVNELYEQFFGACAPRTTFQPKAQTATVGAPIFTARELGMPTSPALLDYACRVRGIPQTVVQDLTSAVAVTYTQPRPGSENRASLALGWRGIDGETWHTRCGMSGTRAKCVCGRQSISTFLFGAPYIEVYEGLFTFLSSRCLKPLSMLNGDALILNSCANVRKAIEWIAAHARNYRAAYLLLDKDTSGKQATATLTADLQALGLRVVDLTKNIDELRTMSEGQDLNDLLVSRTDLRSCKSCRCCRFFAWCSGHGYTERGQWTFRGRSCKYYQQI